MSENHNTSSVIDCGETISQEELEKNIAANLRQVRDKFEELKKEELKEELLRQYEAGQLKPITTLSHNQPRQIPTIEEHRAASNSAAAAAVVRRAASISRPVTVSAPSSVYLPDLSRPPPGYNYPTVPAAVSSALISASPVPVAYVNYEVITI